MDTDTSFNSDLELPADWPTDFPPPPALPAWPASENAFLLDRRRRPQYLSQRRKAVVRGIGPHVALYYLLGVALAIGGLALIGILGALLDWLKAIVP